MKHALVRALFVWALLICAAITLSVSSDTVVGRRLERLIQIPIPPFACTSMSMPARDIAIPAWSPRIRWLASSAVPWSFRGQDLLAR